MPEQSAEEKEAARAERRDVIVSNRAWRTAETVRRAWLVEFAGRKTAPCSAAGFVVAELVAAEKLRYAAERSSLMAREILAVDGPPRYGERRTDPLVDLVTAASETRALMLALVLVLAAYERGAAPDSWRRQDTATVRYLRRADHDGSR